MSFNASVFRDPSGDVKGIFASARDITEQARLQSQLAEERGYNRGLIEASLDGLITVDPVLSITDVNETMCRMSGYSREELLGTPFQQYFTDPKRAADGVRQTLDKGAVTNYELTLRRKDSQELLVSFNAAIFKDESGKVRGIFASARDITEQARLQTQLAEERAYNRGLIEASVDGLVTVNEEMVITDVNETMCQMAEKSRSQLIGSSFPDYFLERELAAEGVRLTFKKGSVTNYVLTLQAGGRQANPRILQRRRLPRSERECARHLCLRPRHHRPKAAGRPAASFAVLYPLADRIEYRRADDHRFSRASSPT